MSSKFQGNNPQIGMGVTRSRFGHFFNLKSFSASYPLWPCIVAVVFVSTQFNGYLHREVCRHKKSSLGLTTLSGLVHTGLRRVLHLAVLFSLYHSGNFYRPSSRIFFRELSENRQWRWWTQLRAFSRMREAWYCSCPWRDTFATGWSNTQHFSCPAPVLCALNTCVLALRYNSSTNFTLARLGGAHEFTVRVKTFSLLDFRTSHAIAPLRYTAPSARYFFVFYIVGAKSTLMEAVCIVLTCCGSQGCCAWLNCAL